MLGQLERVAAEYPFLTGLSASVLAGAGATALGAVPIAFISRLSEGVTNLLLSFAAGIMLTTNYRGPMALLAAEVLREHMGQND